MFAGVLSMMTGDYVGYVAYLALNSVIGNYWFIVYLI